MNEQRICSFFGHREIEEHDRLREKVRAAILHAIELGCRTFYFGGYGAFDDLCYTTLTSIKEERAEQDIRRIYCVAREQYLRKPVRYFRRENYDEVIYLTPSFEGWYKSIYFRNCAMIDQSDFVIFFAEQRENSGAYKAFKYAKRKKKACVNLWDEDSTSEG